MASSAEQAELTEKSESHGMLSICLWNEALELLKSSSEVGCRR